MPKIFISAGDPSGDIHAANLMKELKCIIPNLEFIGIGGSLMQQQGLNSLVPIEDIAVVGFWEVLKRINKFSQLLSKCKNIFNKQKIDLFIPVDFPGFNIKLIKYATRNNIPIAYYIAPQLWAWGSNRAKKLQKVDKLYVVFPFEEDFFRKFGINTEFIGHPLLDNILLKENPLPFEKRENIIALLPGSREQEINKHLKLFIESAKLFKREFHDYKIALAKSNNVNLDKFERLLIENQVEIFYNSLELMKKAKLGIVKTGTSNLEAALAGMPFVMAYRTSSLSYIISKKLISLEYISIVNILEEKKVIDEMIQNDANSKKIAKALKEIIINDEKRDNIFNAFKNLREKISSNSASKTTAQKIKENFFKNFH